MSTDRRRILGPGDAVRPLAATPLKTEISPKLGSSVRKFFVKTGLSKNANGLAYLEVGDTLVEVGVYGPRPIKGLFVNRASFSVETKFLPHVTQPNEVLYNGSLAQGNGRLQLTNIEQKMSTFVETAMLPAVVLEKYPKLAIDVVVTVLAVDANTTSMSNLIAWVVNCTSLAMVDLGVEVRDLVTCGHVQTTAHGVETDALIAESDTDATECVASFMHMQNNEMLAVYVQGAGPAGVSEALLAQLVQACQEMAAVVRRNLNGYLLEAAKQ